MAAAGRTFRELKEIVSIDVSTRALAQTNTEVGEIAAKLGYSELSSFDRAKRITGMSPGAYRRKHRVLPPVVRTDPRARNRFDPES